MPPASSRSEFVTYPLGLSKETRFVTTSSGKCALHTVVYAAVGSIDCREAIGCCYGKRGMAVGPGVHAPPHMYTEASWFPVRIGVRSSSLMMRLGQANRSSASQRKSSRLLLTPLVSVTLLHVIWRRASCIWIKRHLDPVREITIECRYPRTWYNVCMLTRFWAGGISSRICFRRLSRCGGGVIVRLTEPTIHPSRT